MFKSIYDILSLHPCPIYHSLIAQSILFTFSRESNSGLYILNRCMALAERNGIVEGSKEGALPPSTPSLQPPVSLCRSLAYFPSWEEYRGYSLGYGREIASSKLCSYDNSVVNLPTERVSAVSNYRMDFDSLRAASTRRRWKALAAGIDIEILLRDAQGVRRSQSQLLGL